MHYICWLCIFIAMAEEYRHFTTLFVRPHNGKRNQNVAVLEMLQRISEDTVGRNLTCVSYAYINT